MGPNDVDLVRVFSKVPAGATADVTFAVNQPFHIIVEAEAGAQYMNGALAGATYYVGVVLRDLTNNTNIPVTPPGDATGLIPAQWGAAAARTFTFQVPGGIPNADTCCEALAFLRVAPMAAPEPDVSFASSPLFIIHP